LLDESKPLIKPTGFREYDARWQLGTELNLTGAQCVGAGFGTLMQRHRVKPDVVVGHDYRSYSPALKNAVSRGLVATGCRVLDIGLCTTPMAYHAQFSLDVSAVAMITASHNENGWTGIKMGLDRPVTLGPEEMSELKTIVLQNQTSLRAGGSVEHVEGSFDTYAVELLKEGAISRKLRVAAVCGNGTSGAFAPQVLRRLGCEVIEVDCELDFNFPNYNPNPEDLVMLRAMQRAVLEHELDVAFGFDGDGDRCGVVDNKGQIIFSDKIGLMMARDMSALVPNARFVVDVKSTGLFANDPILNKYGASVDYYKTGHSYMKRRTREIDAVAGFEKSGHFFFRPPFGLGYDDGIASAIEICRMLDRSKEKSLADLYSDLPTSHASPTMAAHCDDELKYSVVDRLVQKLTYCFTSKTPFGGRNITQINTVNGIRFSFANGSWGLIRASSNKPELVIVCEGMESETEMSHIFGSIRQLLLDEPAVKAFNQEI
jgi:phosphomannomutase / phosphoglucomutase